MCALPFLETRQNVSPRSQIEWTQAVRLFVHCGARMISLLMLFWLPAFHVRNAV